MPTMDDRPLPSIFTPLVGAKVLCRGVQAQIQKQISLTSFLVEMTETEERIIVPLQDITPLKDPQTVANRKRIPDIQDIPDKKREIGLQRQQVLSDLLKMRYRTRADVQTAGEELGLSTARTYELLARFDREGNWTCLVPHAEKGRPRKKRLLPLVESIIQEAIEEIYRNRHNAPVAEVVRIVDRLCKRAGVNSPAPNSVKSRIADRDAKSVVLARRGKKEARDRFAPVLGPHDEPRWPLQRIEIDHTVADVFVADQDTGLAIGRPILTVVIDDFSRCVLGFFLSLQPPSTLSVALALTHAVLPKNDFLARRNLQFRWDVFGLPAEIMTDSGAEFDSRGLQAGCAQYGIIAMFRPLGQPHFGGRVERLIGSLMGRMKLLPGATMRSIAERGEGYDPEKEAALTLQEAEARIALEIDVYHHTTHKALGVTPLKLWEFGILGDDSTPGRGTPSIPRDPQRFLIDFMPLDQRTVQTYGIQFDYLRYHSPILRTFLSGKRGPEKHIVRYDPRDMSRVFLYDADAAEYHEIPRANANFPPVALWEVKSAIKRLKSQGIDPDDETAIQRSVEQARQLEDTAIIRSKKARRNVERRREDARGRTPPRLMVQSMPEQPAQNVEPLKEDHQRRRARPISDVEEW